MSELWPLTPEQDARADAAEARFGPVAVQATAGAEQAGYSAQFRTTVNGRDGVDTGTGQLTGPRGGVHIGQWRRDQGETSSVTTGATADASTGELELRGDAAGGPGPALQMRGPDFALGATSTDTRTPQGGRVVTNQIGAQASVATETFTMGSPQNNVRVGVSEGVGAAARGRYGDSDNDGLPEIGIGVDAGPFTFDTNIEAPMTEARSERLHREQEARDMARARQAGIDYDAQQAERARMVEGARVEHDRREAENAELARQTVTVRPPHEDTAADANRRVDRHMAQSRRSTPEQQERAHARRAREQDQRDAEERARLAGLRGNYR